MNASLFASCPLCSFSWSLEEKSVSDDDCFTDIRLKKSLKVVLS